MGKNVREIISSYMLTITWKQSTLIVLQVALEIARFIPNICILLIVQKIEDEIR